MDLEKMSWSSKWIVRSYLEDEEEEEERWTEMERSTGPSGTECQFWEVVTWLIVGIDVAIILIGPTIS